MPTSSETGLRAEILQENRISNSLYMNVEVTKD